MDRSTEKAGVDQESENFDDISDVVREDFIRCVSKGIQLAEATAGPMVEVTLIALITRFIFILMMTSVTTAGPVVVILNDTDNPNIF